jgi:hypothetical protein
LVVVRSWLYFTIATLSVAATLVSASFGIAEAKQVYQAQVVRDFAEYDFRLPDGRAIADSLA